MSFLVSKAQEKEKLCCLRKEKTCRQQHACHAAMEMKLLRAHAITRWMELEGIEIYIDIYKSSLFHSMRYTGKCCMHACREEEIEEMGWREGVFSTNEFGERGMIPLPPPPLPPSFSVQCRCVRAVRFVCLFSFFFFSIVPPNPRRGLQNACPKCKNAKTIKTCPERRC